MEEKLRRIMAEVFHAHVDEIKDDASAYTLANWDSLKHINLILAIQKEFGIRFEDEDIPTMTSYLMILNTLKAYLEA